MAVRLMDRVRVFARDGMRCVRCGAEESLQIDHVWPRRHGGRDDLENPQTLCGPCNASKHDSVDGLTPPPYVTWPPPVTDAAPSAETLDGWLPAVRVKDTMEPFIQEWREANRAEDGSLPSKAELVRRALIDFLGRELAEARKAKK